MLKKKKKRNPSNLITTNIHLTTTTTTTTILLPSICPAQAASILLVTLNYLRWQPHPRWVFGDFGICCCCVKRRRNLLGMVGKSHDWVKFWDWAGTDQLHPLGRVGSHGLRMASPISTWGGTRTRNSTSAETCSGIVPSALLRTS